MQEAGTRGRETLTACAPSLKIAYYATGSARIFLKLCQKLCFFFSYVNVSTKRRNYASLLCFLILYKCHNNYACNISVKYWKLLRQTLAVKQHIYLVRTGNLNCICVLHSIFLSNDLQKTKVKVLMLIQKQNLYYKVAKSCPAILDVIEIIYECGKSLSPSPPSLQDTTLVVKPGLESWVT